MQTLSKYKTFTKTAKKCLKAAQMTSLLELVRSYWGMFRAGAMCVTQAS